MTDNELRWAVTWEKISGKRYIHTGTIATTKSHAITWAIRYFDNECQDCESRDSKWRRLKNCDYKVRVEEIVIQTWEDYDTEPEKPVRKRCCDNCISLQNFRTKSGYVARCRSGEWPDKATYIDNDEFICKYHKYYDEVFPNG